MRQSLKCNISCAKISLGYKTDHSLIITNFALHSIATRPGFWKRNTFFLNETEYTIQIRTVIEETHNEYLHENTVNNALLGEMIKLKTREHSIKYETAKKAKFYDQRTNSRRRLKPFRTSLKRKRK